MSNVAYDKVTAHITALVSECEHDWELPWRNVPLLAHRSGNTGHVYTGINAFTLMLTAITKGYTQTQWLTFKQIKAKGGTVRKGEKSAPIMFFKVLEKDEVDPRTGKPKTIPMAKYYNVFNVEQCDGIDYEDDAPAESTETTDILAWAESFATIAHGGNKAFYMPSQHRIQMPHRSQFKSDNGYHATLLHELTHWTMKDLERDVDTYAFEELVAELGSVFMCQHFGLVYELDNHASYLKSWLEKLQDDPKYIARAAAQAQKAADHLIHITDNNDAAEAA